MTNFKSYDEGMAGLVSRYMHTIVKLNDQWRQKNVSIKMNKLRSSFKTYDTWN